MLVEAVGTQITEPVSWDQGTLEHEPMLAGPASDLWIRTAVRPAEVDVAMLYDGFTFNCLSWIEALGFCGMGEGKDFVDGGTRIALDGELPLTRTADSSPPDAPMGTDSCTRQSRNSWRSRRSPSAGRAPRGGEHRRWNSRRLLPAQERRRPPSVL